MVKSDRIVVIGGGAVGLELVGELATDYPSKKVTLMHNKEQILDDRMSQKFVKKIRDGLKALKVETVLGERVDLDDLNVNTIILHTVTSSILNKIKLWGREVYRRQEKREKEAGFPRWREPGEIRIFFATLRNNLQ